MRRRHLTRNSSVLAPLPALVVLALSAAPSVHAAGPYYWDNLAGSGFGAAGGIWSSAGNTGIPGWGTDSTAAADPSVSNIITATTDTGENFGSSTAGLASGIVTVDGAVSSGSLVFGSQAGAITISGGTSINLPATATITVNNASDIIGSILAGATTSLTKLGTGTLTLTGTNTFTGQMIVQNGTLSVDTINDAGTASPMGTSGTNTVRTVIGANGQTGTLQYTGASAISNRIWHFLGTGAVVEVTNANTNLTFIGSSNLNGTGTLTKAGPGTLTLKNGSTGYTSGAIVLTGGTLAGSGNNAVFGAGSVTLTLNGGTTLDFIDTTNRNYGKSTTVNGSMTIIAEKSTAGAGVNYTMGTLAIGTSTLTVSGGNVTSGTAGLIFGTTTLSGAPTFNITNPAAGGTTLLTLGAMINNGNTTTLTGNGNFAQTGAAAGVGGFTLDATFSGTATLNQANLYSGATTVNSGTLKLSGTSTNTIASSPTIHIANGAFLDVTGLTGGSLTLATGQTLNGNGTVTGNLNGGTNGIVSPGGASTALLTVSGGANLAAGHLAIDIDDTQSPQCDKLLVSGTLDITTAKLGLTIVGTPTQAAYVIASYGTLSPSGGPFATITGLPSGYMLDYAYGGNQIAIIRMPPYQAWAPAGAAFDADANNDGISNGMAWMFGAASPTTNAGALLPTPHVTGGNLKLHFSRRHDIGAARLYLQYGTNLSIWNPDAPGLELPGVTTHPIPGTTINVDVTGPVSGLDTFDVSLPMTDYAAGRKLFVRWAVTEN